MIARLVALAVVLFALLPTLATSQEALPFSDSCADYDAWEWAQSVYDQQPSTHEGLDPDGDGEACNELPRGGFAPTWWTGQIPASAVPAQLVSIVDGDTLVVTVDGVEDEVRLYRSDAPEVQGCGGDNATEFAQQALAFNDGDLTVYLESDATARDQYDRRLAYVWWTIDGLPYMLNEVMERSGWARDVDYGDRLYLNQFAMATQFAEKHQIGQYALCGGFNLEGVAGGNNESVDEIDQQGPLAGQCDPSYPDVCIPPIEAVGDLDCPQVPYTQFDVVPPDPHGFDSDQDGIGCEGQR